MKFDKFREYLLDDRVAPFTGAWIEIVIPVRYAFAVFVAPFTGAWIEILHLHRISSPKIVAPFTGAWIEMFLPAEERYNS